MDVIYRFDRLDVSVHSGVATRASPGDRHTLFRAMLPAVWTEFKVHDEPRRTIDRKRPLDPPSAPRWLKHIVSISRMSRRLVGLCGRHLPEYGFRPSVLHLRCCGCHWISVCLPLLVITGMR
jgi:hypothetical protein